MSLDKTDNNKKRVLEELVKSRGIISTACQNAGIARSQFYVWVDQDKEFKAAVDDINEAAIDYVESKLLEKVTGVQVKTGEVDGEDVVYTQAPSDTAIIFYLKCKAKKRGYVERTEQEHIFPTAIKIIRDKDV